MSENTILSFGNHHRCCEILDRYLQLSVCMEKSKVESILVNVNHSICDLNNLIIKYNDGERFSVDELRSGIREVDVMLVCLLDLRTIFNIDVKKLKMDSRLENTFLQNKDKVKRFRWLRGLLLAHPVDMNRGEDTVYLEDVRRASDAPVSIFHDKMNECDFLLNIRGKNEELGDWEGLSFIKDVVDIGHLVVLALSNFNDIMQDKLNTVLSNLQHIPIAIDHSNVSNRIAGLKAVTRQRYPDFVIQTEDYTTGERAEKCVLDEVGAALSYNFDGLMGDIYCEYKRNLELALDRYEDDLQDMRFDTDDYFYDYLKQALRPDCKFLDNIIERSMLSYVEQKICKYLEFSDSRIEGLDAICKFQKLGYEACVNCNVLESQAVAIVYIYILRNVLSSVCDIDFSLPNGMIAAQYWAIVYWLGKMYQFGELEGVKFTYDEL